MLAVLACGPVDGDSAVEVPGATHRFLDASGVRWHWVEAGDGDPLVLLHGMPGTWHSWAAVMPALARHYRVLALDLKAFGDSSAPEGDYSFCGVGAEIAELLEALEITRFRLVGHDWGALIGACLASRAPQRVVAYAHVSAPLLTYDLSRLPDHREMVLAPQQAANFLRRPDVLVLRAYSGGTAGEGAFDADILQRRIDDLRGHSVGVARYFRDMDLQAGWRMGPRMSADWGSMRMPVTLIVGDRDLQVPLELFLDADNVVAGPLTQVVIDDAAHFPAEEQPSRLAEVLLQVLR